MGVTGIMEAMTMVKTTWGAISAAIDVRDEMKLGALKLDFTRQLVALSDKTLEQSMFNAEQVAENIKLREQLAEMTARLKQPEVLEACFLPSGARVYRPRDAPEDGGHYVCPACYETQRLAIALQPERAGSMQCPHCKTLYRSAAISASRPRFARMN